MKPVYYYPKKRQDYQSAWKSAIDGLKKVLTVLMFQHKPSNKQLSERGDMGKYFGGTL